MTFQADIPKSTDRFDLSTNDLLNNNIALNNVFAVDHYALIDKTVNNGKHNTITTPLIVGSKHPNTQAGENKIYAMQDSANLGVLHYSRGEENALPTPLTCIQSPSTPQTIAGGGTLNIFDFTGIKRALCTLYIGNFIGANTSGEFIIRRFKDTLDGDRIPFFTSPSVFTIPFDANILIIRNNTVSAMNNVYWTLQFLRIQND